MGNLVIAAKLPSFGEFGKARKMKCPSCGRKFHGRVNCIICFNLFYKRHPGQITCGSPECKEKRKRQMQSIWKKEQRRGIVRFPGVSVICLICGTTVQRRRLDQTTCLSEECMKKNRDLHKFRGVEPVYVYRNLG